jgi:hypothetical protein
MQGKVVYIKSKVIGPCASGSYVHRAALKCSASSDHHIFWCFISRCLIFRKNNVCLDGWGSQVAPRGLGFDPLVGRILGLVKKIPSLCLVRSRVLSPTRHPPVWAVAEWAVVVGPLVMGGQCSGVFSTGSCWFRDFLSHQWVACALSATPGNVGEDGFTLPGRVFFSTEEDKSGEIVWTWKLHWHSYFSPK